MKLYRLGLVGKTIYELNLNDSATAMYGSWEEVSLDYLNEKHEYFRIYDNQRNLIIHYGDILIVKHVITGYAPFRFRAPTAPASSSLRFYNNIKQGKGLFFVSTLLENSLSYLPENIFDIEVKMEFLPFDSAVNLYVDDQSDYMQLVLSQ